MLFSRLTRPCTHGLMLVLGLLLGGKVWADVYGDTERLMNQRQWDAALQATQVHLQSHPDDPQMRLLLSRIQEQQGQSEQARSTLEALTQQFPELPEPHNNLAVLYAREGRLDDAMASLHKALLARPDYAFALENLGDIHLSLALSAYRRAQQAAPNAAGPARKAGALPALLQTP